MTGFAFCENCHVVLHDPAALSPAEEQEHFLVPLPQPEPTAVESALLSRAHPVFPPGLLASLRFHAYCPICHDWKPFRRC